MLSIAVIADTHDRLPDHVVRAISRADEIWHLGDVCNPSTLDPILTLGTPLFVVAGNNDAPWHWKPTLRLERSGCVFHLEHIAPRRPPAGVHAVLHGHTHVPGDETVLGVRYLNPGCISRPNRGAPPSFAWLSIDGDGAYGWRLESAQAGGLRKSSPRR
jgi:uncharacterized protein